MMRSRKGFTLIELLVVIAIIGILAAMLFPVFARARESARKVQCLANVKNIALAMQMYFTDWDRGLPVEHRAEVIAAFDDQWGGGTVFEKDECHVGRIHANPYLRPPVILDEYIKNRDVWRCPSAKLSGGAMFIYGWTDWFGELQAFPPPAWGHDSDPYLCVKDGCYPNGWGGSVTDSIKQGQQPSSYVGDAGRGTGNAFVMSVAVSDALQEISLSSVADAANTVVCGDAGSCTDFMSPGLLAYPDICAAECCDTDGNWPGCAWGDWENCSSYCSFIYNITPTDGSFAKNPELFKPYTRHMGGSNIGFMDGHAKWWSARSFIDACTEQGLKGVAQPFGMWVWAGAYPQWCGSCCDPGKATFWKPTIAPWGAH